MTAPAPARSVVVQLDEHTPIVGTPYPAVGRAGVQAGPVRLVGTTDEMRRLADAILATVEVAR